MEASHKIMEQDVKPLFLNLGCGFSKHPDAINVDGYKECNPDLLWNLNKYPYPWEDNSIDKIYAYHVFEHIEDWWRTFIECSRILKYMGELEIRVPDPTSDSALAYRDHLHIINLMSFDGIANRTMGRKHNAWAAAQNIVPMALIRYARVPFVQYNWLPIWLLRLCAKYLRNFIWEQRFLFIKIRQDQINLVEGHPRTEYLKLMRKYKPKMEDL